MGWLEGVPLSEPEAGRSKDAESAGQGGGQTGSRAVIAALLSNLAVAAAKLVGFLLTGSGALLAETLHSVADTGNQGLLLLGSRVSRPRPTPEHPFGHGRERYFWAFIVGLVLFGVGGVLSIVEGVSKLTSGEGEVTSPAIGIGLLLFAMVAEGLSLRTAVGEARGLRRRGQTWWQFVRRSKNPDVTVVLLEDSGALVGLLFALIGVGLTLVTGNVMWDALATLAIGVLLCFIAAFLTTEMHSLLVGETASRLDQRAIREALEGTEGITCVLNLRTEHLAPEQILVCAKVALDDPADLDRVVTVINTAEQRVAAAVPATLVSYIEPDHFDPERVSAPWT